MPIISGRIAFISDYNDDEELFFQLQLAEGDVVSICYTFSDVRIAEGLNSRLEEDMLVTCRVKEVLDLDKTDLFTGMGSIKIVDFKAVLSEVFEGFLEDEQNDKGFSQQQQEALRLFCLEAPKALKRKLDANNMQANVIDQEFIQLSSSLRSTNKKEWKKRFIESMVNIGVAFAIDQAVGTAFVLTIAEIIKEIVRDITRKLIAPEK